VPLGRQATPTRAALRDTGAQLAAESVIAVAGISPEQVNDMLELELVHEDTPAPPASRLNGSAGAAEIKSSSHMLSLEFIEDAPAARQDRHGRPARPPCQRSPPRGGAAVVTAPVSDANLILEVLHSRSCARRTNAPLSARGTHLGREAQRDPAALDALICSGCWAGSPRIARRGIAAHQLHRQPVDRDARGRALRAEDRHGAECPWHRRDTLGFEIAEALCTQRRAQVERFITQVRQARCLGGDRGLLLRFPGAALLRSKALRLLKIDPKLTSSALKDKLSQALVVATVQAAKVMGVHCAAKRVDSQARCSG